MAAYERGDLSAEAWFAAERRRAANRLRERWRKDPWFPGSTLGFDEDTEARFRADLAAEGHDVEVLPPAVADTGRWRWMRLVRDRRRPEEWAAFVRSDLPARVRAAGPPPVAPVGGIEVAFDRLFEIGGAPPPYSKRYAVDRPRRSPQKVAPKVDRRRRPAVVTDDDLAALLLDHGPMLRRLAVDEADIVVLAGLLKKHLDAPNDAGSAAVWRAAVAERR